MNPSSYPGVKLCTHLVLVALVFMGFPTAELHAQSLTNYTIPRVDAKPRIDGQIDQGEWSQATRIPVNIETNPNDNVPADVQAEALLMEDGEVLYVAFIALDPDPDQIRAFYRDRDSLWNDDWVSIVLDTFNDERRAFEFFSNPYGVQADAIQDDVNDDEDESWNAIWDSAGQINEDGYVVEMAIPMKQLRFTPSESSQTWGIDLVRFYPRDRDTRIANNPRDRNISCYICQLSKADGFANLTQSRNLEVIPTLTSSMVENRNPALGNWDSESIDSEASLDVRWGISQDLYLNATLNPDFSQVEADSAQLDINNTFSLFFPERRTFFLDGADYFDTFERLVHTRNISDPDYGLKLTGKSGGHTYALLTANDINTSFLIPRSLGSSVASLGDVESKIAIGRYRFDIFENSTIGALITDRRADGYNNTVTSIDAVLRPTDQDSISIQSMHSSSNYPTLIQGKYGQASSLSDSSQRLEYRHSDRRWDWRLGYTDMGDDFRADLGFVNRVDFKFVVATIGHTWRGESDDFFNRIRIALDYDRTEDQSGLQLEEEFEVFVNMNGPKQSFLNGLFGGSETYWNGKYFDEQFNQVWIGFTPQANLRLSALIRVEDIVDFANTRLGRSKRFGPNINYRWGKHLEVDLNYTLQQFDVDGGRLFTANLTDLKTTYQFSARSFLRFTLQHTDNKRNPDLYLRSVQARSKQLTTQLLYSYRFSAATRFFIGYSDAGFQNDTYDAIEKTNRTVFAKFSYAWMP
ncbi:MAG: carbohydrate binding family 9 domain-containing protein [Gammaproteobacteria bacterium]|nr:carbohydrate binding family 9 domain-containing protein [Gammaproteobacteria bacterium]